MAGLFLSRFLLAAARRPWNWGTNDCLMWLADWIKVRRGVDPGRGWRGTYGTPIGAARIVKEAGGTIVHVERCVSPCGIRRTDDPQPGDIAVVMGEAEQGAIVLASGKVARIGATGLVIERLLILAAWRV